MRLGLIDVNLQTEELHCNYSVLIVSLEQEEGSLPHYTTIINFRRIIWRKNYIIIIFPEYDIKEIRDEMELVLKKTNETMKKKWDSRRKLETE